MESSTVDALTRHYNRVLSSINNIKSYKAAIVRIVTINAICIFQTDTANYSTFDLHNMSNTESFNNWLDDYLKELIIEGNLINRTICKITGDEPCEIQFEGGKR